MLCGNTTATHCLKCNDGLTLTSENTCVPETSNSMNCRIGDADSCEYCDEGFYNRKGKCIYSNVQNMPVSLASAGRSVVAAFTLLVASRFA